MRTNTPAMADMFVDLRNHSRSLESAKICCQAAFKVEVLGAELQLIVLNATFFFVVNHLREERSLGFPQVGRAFGHSVGIFEGSANARDRNRFSKKLLANRETCRLP